MIRRQVCLDTFKPGLAMQPSPGCRETCYRKDFVSNLRPGRLGLPSAARTRTPVSRKGARQAAQPRSRTPASEPAVSRDAPALPTRNQKPAQRLSEGAGCLHSTREEGGRERRPYLAAESASATPPGNYNSQYRSYPDSRKPMLGRPEAAETQSTGLRLIQPGKKGAGRAVGHLSIRHYERGFCSEAVYFQNDRGQRARHEGTSHG